MRGWASVSLSNVRLARASVPALGIDPTQRSVKLTLVSGRMPRRDNEVALGQATLRQVGASVGDTITARGNGVPERLHVVGRVVLPGLGLYPGSDKTALGEGAVLTQRALERLGSHFEGADFLVVFRDVSAQQRKAVIDDAGATSALLKTLGFTRRQVSSTVAWQATTVGIVALAIGMPFGIIAGRWTWSALAADLGTPSEPRIPLLALLAGLPAVLVLVNAVAFVPGRLAARLRPAVVLRTE